jgi:hypothetical protein
MTSTNRIHFTSLEAKTPAEKRREANAEGYNAYSQWHRDPRGWTSPINPYNPHSTLASAWAAGWAEAQRDLYPDDDADADTE